MGISIRPDATAVTPQKQPPNGKKPTESVYPGLPFTMPRILSPEEFEQARTLPSSAISQANFPVAPPVPKGGGSSWGDPGVGEQVKGGLQAIGHAAANPKETAKAMASAIVKDLGDLFLAPVEGGRNDRDTKTGLLRHPNLPEGAIITKENTPNAISPRELHEAAINTAINAAFAVAPEFAAPARIAANAAVGAYYDPEQPIRGATAGAVLGEGFRAVIRGAPAAVKRAAEAVRKAPPEQAPAVRAAVLESLSPEDRRFIESNPEVNSLFNDAGFFDAGQHGNATVTVKPGTKIEGEGALDTVSAVRQAIEQVGRDEFRARVTAEVEKRGGAGDPVIEMAATEQIAREIATAADPMVPSRFRARAGAVGDLGPEGSGSPFIKNASDPLIDTKVTDPQGKPLVVYHGTTRNFDTFRVGHAPGWGEGIYFTDNAAQAGSEFGYGGRVIPARIALRNPYRGEPLSDLVLEKTAAWKEVESRWQSPVDAWQEDSHFVGQVLRELGYDGVMVEGSNNIDGLEIVAFRPDQVIPVVPPNAALNRTGNRAGAIFPKGGSGSPLRPNTPRQATGTGYTAPLDAGDNPRMLHVAKLGLSPDGEAQLRAMLPATGEKVKVTHAETEALARELELDPEALQRRIGDWSGAEALAARNLISQNAERIVELSKVTADGTAPIAEREAAQAEIARLTFDVRTLSGRLAGERSKAGRDLNAYKILAKNTMEPAVWLAQAQRVRGHLGITPEQQATILQLTNQKDRAGLISYISTLHQSTKLEKGISAWKAGLLTGTGTHITNMAGGALTVGLENIKDIPATAIDIIASTVTGERTKAPSFRGNIVEAFAGTARGVRKSRKLLKEGDTAQLEKWDFRRTNYDSPVIDWYVNGVFNLLGAEDQVWRGAAMGRAMEEELRLRARQLAKMDVTPGGQDVAFKKILADLRENPPADVVIKATAEADYALLQAPNAPHQFISAGKRAVGDKARAAVDVVVPFTRTPTNAALVYGVDYTPLGLFTTLAKQIKEPSQRKLADGLGRSITGSSFLMLGVMLMKEGLMTGNSVSDVEAAQGKKPHSILINGRWHDLTRIPGPGTLMAMGGQAYQDMSRAEATSDKIAAGAFANIRVIADQPMVSGLSGLTDVIREKGSSKEPGRDFAGKAGKYVARQTASVIPTGVSQLAGALDDKVRAPEGIVETVKSRIPGLRETVPAKQDVLGREITNDQSGHRAYWDFLRSQVANPDPLLEEMARLEVAPPQPGKKVKIGKEEYERSDEERRTLKQVIGREVEKRLRKVMKSDAYQELTDDEKKVVLERVIGNVREGVYGQEKKRVRKQMTAAATMP